MTQNIRSHLEFKSEMKIKAIYNWLVEKPFGLDHFLKISNRH